MSFIKLFLTVVIAAISIYVLMLVGLSIVLFGLAWNEGIFLSLVALITLAAPVHLGKTKKAHRGLLPEQRRENDRGKNN